MPQFVALGAQRVFLAAPDGMNDEPLALEDCPRLRDQLKAGLAFFEPRGIAG